jgi:hypothetical protein
MKIITSKGIYLQVKDLTYLFNITGFSYFKKAIKVGNSADEFVLITNNKIIEIINNSNGIVDFNEIYQMDLATISEFILSYSKSSLFSKDETNRHYLEGLRDVLDFKKGSLDYKIPLIKGEVLYDDGSIIISGTTISDIFYVKGGTTNIKDILISLFDDVESLEFDTIRQDEESIIRIKNVKRKKASIIGKIRNRKEGN